MTGPMNNKQEYFQDYLPGNTCFGCGSANDHGLQIKSFWDGDIAKCIWQPEHYHEGWAGLTCGGVIATLIDCHCIATAMATAIRNEKRALNSEPHYLFATGALNITYLKPSPVSTAMELRAQVTEIKFDKKYSLSCDVYVDGEKTVESNVVALLVYRSDKPEESPEAFRIN